MKLFDAAEVETFRAHYMALNAEGSHDGDYSGVEGGGEVVPEPVDAGPERLLPVLLGRREVGDGDHDAPAEADALEVARPHELVGGGAADAEDLAGLLTVRVRGWSLLMPE